MGRVALGGHGLFCYIGFGWIGLGCDVLWLVGLG
jgi:hypothetical protein